MVGPYYEPMTTNTTPTVGQTYTVTDALEAPHYFAPGTKVRAVEDNSERERRNRAGQVTRAARPADRWLCRGPKADGTAIVQWLAAGDLALA